MTNFLLAALALTGAALLFVLPPLLRHAPRKGGDTPDGETGVDPLNLAVLRDQRRELEREMAAGTLDPASYREALSELQARTAREVGTAPRPDRAGPAWHPWTALALGLGLPALSMALYVLLGTPLALDPLNAMPAQTNPHAVDAARIEAMVAQLAQRQKDNPGDAEGWKMLARSYNVLGRFGEAANAYARLLELVPPDAGLYADYADTLGMAQNRSMQGEPERLAARALELDPDHVKALALAGSAAFERGDYATAVARWQRIVALEPADSEFARATADSISEAKILMERAGAAPAAR
ncbi:MAG: c-type cytochrome biogenesis protein CcmI [Noviherbaspirillum sp.]